MKETLPESNKKEACSVCHLPLLPEYYFCPNCGTKVVLLGIDPLSQFKLYLFSLILPLIAFIAISNWHGMRYIRSDDPKRKVIGWIALSLIILSTVVSTWYTIVVVRNAVSGATKDLNQIMQSN